MGGKPQRLIIIGDVGVDLVLGPISEWPRVGTETLVERSELRAGGSAANESLAVSYLGGHSQLLSVVGTDESGAWLRGQLGPLGATLAVKTGARGALGAQDGERSECAAPQASIFDTVGAGDAFNAGYLLARLDGAGLAASLAAGCRAASAIIARFPRRSIAAGDLAALRASSPLAAPEHV